MKTAALLALPALVSLALPASADELVVGALRDQDGGAVAGATITALATDGTVLARDRSAADGTFALTAPTRPATVLVSAPDAEPLRVAVAPGSAPVTAVVRRHRSADLIPTAADVAALPAGSLGALGSVVPYRVAFSNSIADRWLAAGSGATTVEGLPFYRRGDGSDPTALLPAHATGSLSVRDPLQAPWYGDRAGGGAIDARLFDRTDADRVTGNDASLSAGRDAAVLAATSWDPDGVRRLVAARAAETFGPVGATVVALAGDAPQTHYAGAGLDLRSSTQRFDLGAHLALTADDSAATGEAASVADIAFDASGRGPGAVAVRARWRDERSTFGAGAEHHDAALVFGTSRGNLVRATASVALAYGDERAYDELGKTSAGYAVLPSLSLDAPLGPDWTVHAGAAGSSLGTPDSAIARASLGEVGFTYTDGRRLHAHLVAYAEGTLEPQTVNRGLAASLGWEIAPRLSLRTWLLRDGDVVDATSPAYPAGPLQPVTVHERFDRNLAWLTWDGPLRFDLLLRGHALEGNLRFPAGGPYALTLGSYVRPNASRVVTFGLVAR